MKDQKYQNLYTPISVFIFCVGLSIIASYYVKKDNEVFKKQELEITANDIKLRIENRLNSYIQFSQNSSSLFMVSDTIKRNDWKLFVEKSKVEEHLKGFQGVAYIDKVSVNSIESHQNRFRKELDDNYKVFPAEQSNKEYTPIIYIEPIESNYKAIGFNISSNLNMKKALEQARDLNKSVLTDKVTLIQDGTKEGISGGVIYAPIYKKNMPLNTIEERRAAIKNWSAISFRLNDFMQGIIGDVSIDYRNKITLKIFDKADTSIESLLFDSGATEMETDFENSFLSTVSLPIELNNKQWTLQFTQLKNSFVKSLSFGVLIGGLIISTLLGFLVFFLVNTAAIAKRMADKLSIDLLGKNKELLDTNNLLKESYSELKLAQEMSKASEEKFKSMTEISPMAIYMSSGIEQKAEYVNPTFVNLFGYSIEEVPTVSDWWPLAYPDKEYRELIAEEWQIKVEKAITNGSKIEPMETIVTCKNGSKKNILWGYISTSTRNGAFGLDLTESRIIEKQLISAKEKAEESNRLKTEFLNNMSHEIRTPMNGIIGFSDLLNNDDLSQDKRRNYVNIIKSSGQQLLQVIDDIIDISILGTKQIKVIETEFRLNDLMLELFSIFDLKAKENKTPLYVKNGLSDKRSLIISDKTKLNKLISNLLENSLKFTHTGTIEFGYHLVKEELEIYVKDTGIGIDSDMHELIFERFSQAEKDLSKKVGGLGLGLSIVKENVELLGGKIRLESKKGEGSTFIVTIPYKSALNEDVINQLSLQEGKKHTVLIAEDEEVNYLYVEILLNEIIKLDCNILHAKNGKEAVDLCKQNEDIKLVLMDLKMPIMNGYTAASEIKKIRPELPIIAQTAYSENDSSLNDETNSFCDFISKPINNEKFKTLVEKYLK